MPRPIPVPVRRTVVRLWEQGHAPDQIAEALAVPCSTVRRLIRRFRQRGPAGLDTDYRQAPDLAEPTSGLVRTLLQSRREHPTWGAGLIRLHLLQETWGESVPSVRTLQRWLLRADLAPAPAGRRPKANVARASTPHDTWQMDAKELIAIKTRKLVSWLRLVDECSGAALRTAVFPPGRWNQVPPSDARDQLRQAFSRWGLPGRFRVDNGAPWGSKGDWPTELALWLIGLGIGMIWNTPSRPQENGVVERSQGTADRWGEPWTCMSHGELEVRLERMDQLHREVYPYRNRLSRLAYYPGLAHSGRPYATESEAGLWDWGRVTAHLTGYAVARRVSRNGMVSIYNRGYYVGRIHQGKEIYVTFDPDTNEWVFSDTAGRELRHKTAQEMSPERVMALDVTDRRL